MGSKGKKWLERGRELKKKKAKGKAAKEAESDSDEDAVGTKISAVALFNDTPYIYDTGASHHFMCHKSAFQSSKKRSKPFKFDQAVGAMVLTKQGTARTRFGKLELHLHDALYSPTSSCNIISTARLERLGNIIMDTEKEVLILRHKSRPSQPIARIVKKNSV